MAAVFSETRPAGAQSFVDSPGNVPDGSYTLRVSARDAIGRTSRAAAPLTVSRALVSFSADAKLVSPNGDGRRDTVTFRFGLAQPAVVTLSLVARGGDVPRLHRRAGAGPAVRDVRGHAPPTDHRFPTASTRRRSRSAPSSLRCRLTVDNTPPTLTLVSVAPLTLRVYEQVTVIATVNGKVIRASKKAGVFELAKGETVQSLNVVVRDAAGNESLPVTYPADGGVDPAVIALLELLEDRREQLSALDRRAFQRERGRRQARLRRELRVGLRDVDAGAEDDSSLGCLGENPRHLPAADEDVVRRLDVRRKPRLQGDRRAHGLGCEDRQLRQPLRLHRRRQHDREEEAGFLRRLPHAAESPAPGGLLVSGDDRALGRAVEHALGRRARLEPSKRNAEPASRDELHRRTTLGLACNPVPAAAVESGMSSAPVPLSLTTG